jgi:uncharacterized protein (DUF305 family)
MVSHYRTSSTTCAVARLCFAFTLIYTQFSVQVIPVLADEPGRGLTAQFEINYLKFIIDHHYSALRITELATGTDPARDAAISPSEGTSPSPTFPASAAKATLDEIRSLARRANRMQREEILEAQAFLRDWYKIEYQPQIRPMNRRQIELLEHTPAGEQFNHYWLETFSRHHYLATTRTLECLVSSELRHKALERYCRGILNGQLSEIDAMRELLCRNFNICDYQPLTGLKGRHTGSRSEDVFGLAVDGKDENEQP